MPNQILQLILIGLLTMEMISCGNSADMEETTKSTNEDRESETTLDENDEITSTETNPVTTTEPKIEYVYPSINLGGESFTIINTTRDDMAYTAVDFETSTGEKLDDAIYERNRELENKFNFKLEVEEFLPDKANKQYRNDVMVQGEKYDVGFLNSSFIVAMFNYSKDIDSVPGLQLDKPWWDKAATDRSRLGAEKHAMYAVSDMSLAGFEGTAVTFFNENLFSELKLDSLYQLVSDGKWTFDKLNEYMKAAENLNYEYVSMAGNSETIYNSLISSAGIDYIGVQSDESYYFGGTTDRFAEVASKINTYFGRRSVFVGAADDCEKGFANGKILFMNGKLSSAAKLDALQSAYGIVPVPKWDESQEEYSSLCLSSNLLMIPADNFSLEETGAIIDAMAYLTYENVLPEYYDSKVSPKKENAEETIEMLKLIGETRYTDLITIWGRMDLVSERIVEKNKEKYVDFSQIFDKKEKKPDDNIAGSMERLIHQIPDLYR